MKTFSDYLNEVGLGDLGWEDVANRQSDFSLDSFGTVKKAVKIVWEGGEKYQRKLQAFLQNLSRDLPELKNLIGFQDNGANAQKMVATPSPDMPPDQQAGNY